MDELNRLETLKTIAETLNQGNELKPMLQLVLERLLDVTGIQTGWIYLVDEAGKNHLIADFQLPPALSVNEKKPMCGGNCWCIERYKSGRLTKAVNIIECKRIENSVCKKAGDTKDITHHMTVPLYAGDEMFGLLNVASPNKVRFSSEELALLQSIAFQIGAAMKRMRLFQKEQKRASLYERLNHFVASIRSQIGYDRLLDEMAQALLEGFPWNSVELVCNGYGVERQRKAQGTGKEVSTSVQVGKTQIHLMIRHDQLDEVDREVIDQLTNHIGLLIENERLIEERKEISVLQERNRLARDLHDSVNQLLFSLNLTLRGTREMTDDPTLTEVLSYSQDLSREALKEMKALIWQLRPPGLEEGVTNALFTFAEKIGLNLKIVIEGVVDLPQLVEECLWRVGQEALQNVKKHAKTTEVTLRIVRTTESVVMEIEDKGSGFAFYEGFSSQTIGLKSMGERVELLHGELEIITREHQGTRIRIVLP
ncbi:GAF domain-containing sensor histidine kinase [Paenibacillus sp.]|jgi:signal transduction histidine kinase|uniref:GAF domain-containing sensor histidine kinase n=1 Tax=Paenibacillus sp. TaxID=58172 RepID=UPI002818E275|nr:GAF domain-containing sensor histidine kinase [Paenibacillus sp.]MDR0268660.1 GAF domain-containing sensor histidine kinase [Paenibacillus sp.]